MASRSLLAVLDSYKQRMGWSISWVSSGATDFNRDFTAWTEQDRRDGPAGTSVRPPAPGSTPSKTKRDG